MSSNNYGDLATMQERLNTVLSHPDKAIEHPALVIIYQIIKQISDYFRPYQNDKVALMLAAVKWKIEKGQTVLGALLPKDAQLCNVGATPCGRPVTAGTIPDIRSEATTCLAAVATDNLWHMRVNPSTSRDVDSSSQ